MSEIPNDLKCMTFSKNDISRIEKESYNQALEDMLNRCIEKDNCYVSIQQIRDSVKELKK